MSRVGGADVRGNAVMRQRHAAGRLLNFQRQFWGKPQFTAVQICSSCSSSVNLLSYLQFSENREQAVQSHSLHESTNLGPDQMRNRGDNEVCVELLANLDCERIVPCLDSVSLVSGTKNADLLSRIRGVDIMIQVSWRLFFFIVLVSRQKDSAGCLSLLPRIE